MKIRFDKPEAGDPLRDRGIKVSYAPAKRQLARWRWYLILLVVSSPLLYFVSKFAYSSVVVEAPGFISQEQISIGAPVQGHVDEIYVKPLQEVRAGDLLMRLTNQDLDLRAQQLRAELGQLSTVKVESTSGPLPTKNLEDQLNITRRQKEELGERVAALEDLVGQGAATESELAALKTQYNQSMSKIAELYQSMAVQNRTVHTGQQEQVQIRTRILALRTELANIDAQLASLQIRATKDGRIVDLPVIKGDQLAIGAKVASLAPNGGELRIAAYIPPKHSDYAIPGKRATVVFPDGVRRSAEIIDVPEVTRQIPSVHTELFGNPQLGVMARMKFIDAGDDLTSATDGLPVKLRFENDWNDSQLPQWLAQLDLWYEVARSHMSNAMEALL